MEIIPVLVFCLTSCITPGPNNIMLMSAGLNYGVKKAVPHLLGISFGYPILVASLGLGLGAVFVSFPIVHPVLKIVGAAYLLYLAWKIASANAAKDSNGESKPFTFFQAALFQWVNPKGWIVAIGAIATFTTPENIVSQMIVILLGYLVLGFLSMLVWLLLGASLNKLIHNQKQLRIFNVSMAVLLVLSVVPMVS